MKQIVNRKTGKKLTVEEAQTLCQKLKVITGTTYLEHTSVTEYSTAEMAEKANMVSIFEAYGYSFAFTGSINNHPEGYRAHVIAIKDLPVAEFEKLFPEYIVIGE